ncbi:MAG TPA: N-acetyl-gamma-glutamyl-phosphate reductase [Longimicrobiales bacterium]|nr:N-acetyl-gamma-glutamyl-phosphate reductase [Longimicrobiales bacterium]
MHNNTKTIGIIGASGYTGQELVALLARHPGFDLRFATSEAEAGKLLPGSNIRYSSASTVELGSVDLVFSCLPSDESGEWSRRAARAGARVIDLSSDLRAPGSGAVYGLPELWRSEITGAPLVANPGCYPTGVMLGLAPALKEGLIDHGCPIVIDAASGVTGAGRSARRDLLFGEVSEDFRAYGAGNVHRHVPEMKHGLGRLNGGAAQFIFTPHLLPVRRGILETMYLPLKRVLTPTQASELWNEHYRGERFIEICGDDLPTLRRVLHRNVVSIGFSSVSEVDRPTLIVVAALDNLVKGAAGQALQNANLMVGFDEAMGLPQ